MLKIYRVVGGGPCDFSVSPRSKSFFFSFFGGLLFDLGQGLGLGLGPGLDKNTNITQQSPGALGTDSVRARRKADTQYSDRYLSALQPPLSIIPWSVPPLPNGQ